MAKMREIVWGLYDFADTMFSMNVVSLYFPLLVVSDLGGRDFHVSFANSFSQAAVIFAAPLLGTFSDKTGKRMPYLWITALLCIAATIGIGIFAKQSMLVAVLLCFGFANFCYNLSLTFYNALLPRVCASERWGFVSGLGTALGYVGSIVGMISVMPFVTGELFGLRIFSENFGRAQAFLPTALLFAAFALPTLLYFSFDERKTKYPADDSSSGSLTKIFAAFRDTKAFPGVRRFVVARLFYQEGVETTIVFMGIFAKKVMGKTDGQIISFMVLATAAAVLGSWAIGKISDKIGHHRTLMAVLVAWFVGLCVLGFYPRASIFLPAGCFLGIALGGVWTCTRPYLLQLAPAHCEGMIFGLYSLSGKAAAVFGPLLWGGAVLLFSSFGEKVSYCAAVISMALVIAIGAIILHPNRKLFIAG